MKPLLFLAVLIVCPGLAGAGTIGEEDAIVVNRINGSDFEVVQGTNFGAAEFWCGAATFVERRSGLSELTAIYIKAPRGPSRTAPGRKAVLFSTSSAGLPPAPQSRTLSVNTPGATLKSVQARRYCRDAFTRSTK